ncbi:MAG: hypothetical protein KDD36_09315 [Flavobacteriales bacterium]|nr:hypothetical protein [Flavobacteriales bacterium]
MTTDWNWYFSAFAQCGAALIGIIAAFIISKLLGENEKSEKNANDLEELIIASNDLKKRLDSRHFAWYDRKNIEYSDDLEEAIKRGDFKDLTEQERLGKLFEIESTLYRTEACLGELDKRISEVLKSRSIYDIVSMTSIPPAGMWNRLEDERNLIKQLKIEAESLIEKFNLVRSNGDTSDVNVKPIRTVIYILAIGFLLTVIYPLHFLPLRGGEPPQVSFDLWVALENILSLRGILLLALTLVIEGILAYFLLLINRLQAKNKSVSSKITDEYTSIKNYHPLI